MPLTLTVGSDGDTLGELRLRDGKAEVVADTDGAKQQLEQMAEMYAGQMVQDGGADPDSVTAEALLRFMASRLTGRTWGTLSDGQPDPLVRAGENPTGPVAEALRALAGAWVQEGGAGAVGVTFPR